MCFKYLNFKYFLELVRINNLMIKDFYIRIFAIFLSMLVALSVAAFAHADEKIRLNPNYKGPTEQKSPLNGDEIITEDLGQDFIQFLDTPDDDDQYILLKESKDNVRPIISLSDNDSSDYSITFDQEFQYNPSLSFDMAGPLPGYNSSSLFTHNIGGSRAVFSLGKNSGSNNGLLSNSALKLFVGSSFIQSKNDRYSTPYQNSFIGQQAYNLSLGVGYSGFQLGASFSQNDNLLAPDLSGYDLGLGYAGSNWSANLKFGEYNSGPAALITSDMGIFDNISAYELGAAYRLFPNLNLTGRFTYYSYGVGSEVMPIDDVKSLIFGTNLSF